MALQVRPGRHRSRAKTTLRVSGQGRRSKCSSMRSCEVYVRGWTLGCEMQSPVSPNKRTGQTEPARLRSRAQRTMAPEHAVTKVCAAQREGEQAPARTKTAEKRQNRNRGVVIQTLATNHRDLHVLTSSGIRENTVGSQHALVRAGLRSTDSSKCNARKNATPRLPLLEAEGDLLAGPTSTGDMHYRHNAPDAGSFSEARPLATFTSRRSRRVRRA